MVKRKGLGKGKGSGYHNIIGKDPKVHSMSAKGVKQPQEFKNLQNNEISQKQLNDEEDRLKDEIGLNATIALHKHLKNEKNAELEEFEEKGDGIYEIETDSGDFILFESEEKAEKYAKDKVYDMLSDEPTIFETEFLKKHLYMTETDINMMADDLTNSQIESLEQEPDSEIVERYGDYDEYQELDEKLTELRSQKGEIDSKKEEQLQNKMSELVENAKESARDRFYEETRDKLKNDPLGYLSDEEGIDTKENLMERNFIKIDKDKASEEAVSADGWEHFVGEGESEQINYTENGKTNEIIIVPED